MRDAAYIVVYDGQCRICRRGRQMIERLGPTTPVRFVDANDRRALAQYPEAAGADVRGQMHVVDPAGQVTGGYDALVALAPVLPVVAWARGVLGWGPVRAVGRRAYRWLAANRYRLGGQVSCHAGPCETKL
jgi:predicted DCC family thiol-disulfide oxidoreductase YuxK